MIPVPSEIEGKEATFGEIEESFQNEGFVLGGNWEYESGYFDAALEQEGGETIYLRLPVQVVKGELNDKEATLKFLQPLIVRHVVNTKMTYDDSLPLVDQMPLATNNLVNQFQKPLEVDGDIQNEEHRIQEAQAAISKIISYLH